MQKLNLVSLDSKELTMINGGCEGICIWAVGASISDAWDSFTAGLSAGFDKGLYK